MKKTQVLIEEIIKDIDIPETAYEAAKTRYEDISDWLIKSPKSRSAKYNPYIFPQGSFRFGTVIKPLEKDDYDLDLSCKLQDGINKTNFTQKQLKELVGADLESYRIERNIKEELEAKHRCWRINYKDIIKFHIDTVPCIPEVDDVMRVLKARMIKSGENEYFSEKLAELAVSITDDRMHSYPIISPDWHISNPEGYARWFIEQMKKATQYIDSITKTAKVAKVDEIPVYKWKTPLQRIVQILKRHRDVMFKDNTDGEPISIIITTLAAKSYNGEDNIVEALQGILSRMGTYVYDEVPRVPNPVNSDEDFADKWPKPEGRELKLEDNFWEWLNKAKEDIDSLDTSDDVEYLSIQARKKYGANISITELGKKIGLSGSAAISITSKTPKDPVDLRGSGRRG